jgi:hypothetical protein
VDYGGQLGLPDHGDVYDRDTAQKPGRRRLVRSATGTAPQETTPPRAGYRRDQAAAGVALRSPAPALAHCCRVLELGGYEGRAMGLRKGEGVQGWSGEAVLMGVTEAVLR